MGSSPFTRTKGQPHSEVVLFHFHNLLNIYPINQKKPRGEAEKPYGSEWLSGTGITLIAPVVTTDSLYLAETYSPVGSHTDKSDNLHLNGDYHKMLVCSHLYIYDWKIERTTVLVAVPPRYETIKKSRHPF